MIDNNFIVKYVTSRNCFLVLSEPNIKKLSFQKIVKLTYDSKNLFCSCVLGSEISANNYIGIPSLYAKALGIAELQTVYISDVLRLPTLSKIMISPVSSDDYEILELSSDTVQSTLLDQIRVVNKNQHLTIWISKWLHVKVKIDDAEPMSYGCLANLTEVYISPPKKIKTSIDKQVSVPQEIVPKISDKKEIEPETEISEFQDCAELRRLKKYLSIKKPVVYRVCPLITPQLVNKNDIILTYPFNVFIFKQDVPKFINSNSYKEVLLCKISKIEPPADFRDAKEENSTMKNDMIVRVCVIEDYYNYLSDDSKFYFDRSLTNDKYPVIFIPEKTMSLFDVMTGSKVIMGNNFDFQSDVRSVELIFSDRKIQNGVQRFKTYLVDLVKYSKCILNSDISIEIEPNVFCTLKFSPPSEFCLFGEFTLRNCKFYENSDKRLEIQKHDALTTLINLDDVCTDICGFENIIRQGETLLSLQNHNENILIVGKSGSGKTTISKYIAQKLSLNPYFMHVVYISCKKLKGKTVENLHKYLSQDFQNMIYYQPALIILDDLSIICNRHESGEVQTQDSIYSNRVSEMLSELIEIHQKTNKISVIATAESTIKLNENILSSRGKHLFRNVFKIAELDKMQRKQIIKNFFMKKASVADDVDFDELAVKTEGYVIQDLKDFTNKSIFETFKRNVNQNDENSSIIINAADINTTLSNNIALALRDVKIHSGGEKDFRDVGGLEDIKKTLIESMNWPSQYPELFNAAPLRLQSGILLYGPPGVGKTLLVSAAAHQCGLRLIAVKGPELLSKYIGASEQAVRNIFEKAQSARPCILFFDEFDSLAPRRGHDSTGVTDRVVNQLLTQLDGVESLQGVFVVAATSRPDLLDPALLRPGRLDRQMLCPVPDEESRLSILKALSRSLQFAEDVELKKIASVTEGFSGADLQAVLYTAQLYAVEDSLRSATTSIDDDTILITNEHVEDSLKGTGASLTKQEAARYEKIYSKFQNKKEQVDETMKHQKATLA